MRSTTNILIINLAISDLMFVIFCVPFTATDYILPDWPFGNLWCKFVSKPKLIFSFLIGFAWVRVAWSVETTVWLIFYWIQTRKFHRYFLIVTFHFQVQYMIVVTCHASVYTLVLMSLDRFLGEYEALKTLNWFPIN